MKEMVTNIAVPNKQIAGYIQRSSMIYKTGVEYADLAMNHVFGCSHGCKYPCYAFLNKRRWGQTHSHEEWCQPFLVANTLELLKKEISKVKTIANANVQLCFATDPFMYGYREICDMSIRSIALLNQAGIRCTTLTKGILPLELAYLSRENEHGISLISLNESFREVMEPGASPYAARLQALKNLHDLGCKTWISMEPYPVPTLIEQNLFFILEAVSWVDRIVFGRWNYCSEISKYPEHRQFYNETARLVMDFCAARGIECHIKEKTITD